MKQYNNLIKDICHELDIKMDTLSGKWVIRLEKNKIIKFIYGYKFPLNDHASGNLIDDKGLLYDLLTFKQIPIIEHFVLYKDYDHKKVLDYFNLHNHNIIVKGNVGTCGNEVYKVNDVLNLYKTIDYLFLSQYSVSLCPFYDIKTEYRVIALNKEIKLIYGKKKQLVIGDGIKNLEELSLEYNYSYYHNHPLINKDYVLKKGEEYLLNYKFNLSNGTKMFLDVDDDKKNLLTNLALQVVKEANIDFGSVDIIETIDNQLLIIEVNSGIMMNYFIKQNGEVGLNIAKKIYKEAIERMFNLL